MDCSVSRRGFTGCCESPGGAPAEAVLEFSANPFAKEILSSSSIGDATL